MENEKERLENLDDERFYFILFNGTMMPNNRKFNKLSVFEDTFIEETENSRRENLHDYYFIQLTINTVIKHLSDIEKLENLKGEAVKNSHRNEFKLKINDKKFSVNRNVLNEEGKQLYDEFINDLYKALNIKK